jgi:hypothetical protein
MASFGFARLVQAIAAPALALALSGCMGINPFGPSGNSAATANVAGPGAGEATAGQRPGDGEAIDVRRFLGPDYCPEIRVLPGTEMIRQYESGHDGDPAYVVWQASFGENARECLYDGQGGLTLRVGVSGRVIAGPKGGPAAVSLPLKIVVIKYKEAVLASQAHPLSVTIPAQNSTIFNEVYEIAVPSPGTARDYLIFVGFDPKNTGMVTLDGTAPAPPPPKPVRPRRQPAPQATPAPARQPQPSQQPAQQPNMLPVPQGELPQGW